MFHQRRDKWRLWVRQADGLLNSLTFKPAKTDGRGGIIMGEIPWGTSVWSVGRGIGKTHSTRQRPYIIFSLSYRSAFEVHNRKKRCVCESRQNIPHWVDTLDPLRQHIIDKATTIMSYIKNDKPTLSPEEPRRVIDLVLSAQDTKH